MLAALQSGQIDYLAIYRSDALQHNLKYIALPPQIDLSDPSLAATYATVTVQGATGPTTGKPIIYGLTIPVECAQSSLAEKFVGVRFGPKGQAVMQANGFVVIAPALASSTNALPSSLGPADQGVASVSGRWLKIGSRARRAWSAPRGAFPALLWVGSGLLLAFILLPMLRLGAGSSFSSLGTAISDVELRDAIFLSLEDAAITAAIATVLGVPLAYLLAKRRVPAPGLVQAIVDLPLAVPHTVAGIALLFLLGRAGWIGAPAGHLGISFYGTQWGDHCGYALRERPVRGQ